MKNKLTNKTIRKTTNLNNLVLLNSNSSCISNNEMWTASPLLVKSSICNLKKIKCYLKAFYCNGLYFTLSPEVFKVREGNPNLMFEKKLRMAENENLSYSMEGMRC